MTSEAKKEVETFLLKGEKIAAIKHLKDVYGFSLEESKVLVEAMEQTISIRPATAGAYGYTTPDESLKSQVLTLLERRQKIEAIKLVKKTLGMPLNTARKWVDDFEREMKLCYRKPWRNKKQDILIYAFMAVGILLISGAGYIYLRQSQSIQQSDLVKGKVIRMKENEEGLQAPVIEYEWRGQKWLYASVTYSSPPAFAVDEEVPVYVNRQEPDDITVDTFSERYLLILILGVLGMFFTGIPLLILFLTTPR